MIEYPHQNNFFFKLRILSQTRWDENAILFVTAALKCAANKHPPEAAHVIILFGHGENFGFYLSPFIKLKPHQAAVHAGDHKAAGTIGSDEIPEPGWDDDTPFGV
jgi:hypothetical protein